MMNHTPERQKLLERIKTPDPQRNEQENRVLIALAEFQNGFPVDQDCASCGERIVVEDQGTPVCAWVTDCPCHHSQSTLRGL